jgi:hypothetical protein
VGRELWKDGNTTARNHEAGKKAKKAKMKRGKTKLDGPVERL